MNKLDKLKRVTDLFVEGRPYRPAGSDLTLWVNKLNSFEVEESRRDGMAARADRIRALRDENNSEVVNVRSDLAEMSDTQLAEARTNQEMDTLWLKAVNDLETTDEWRDELDYMRRMPTLLDDEGAPSDDPRRERVAQLQTDYYRAVQESTRKLAEARKRELGETGREQLEKDFIDEWRMQEAMGQFMAEKRVTEIFYALRDEDRTRLLDSRADVRDLPDGLISEVIDILDDLQTNSRTAGNSGAPESSSASSEQPSAEAGSSPSTPEATPSAVPTT